MRKAFAEGQGKISTGTQRGKSLPEIEEVKKGKEKKNRVGQSNRGEKKRDLGKRRPRESFLATGKTGEKTGGVYRGIR